MQTVFMAIRMRFRRVQKAAAGKVCRMLESIGVLADEETSARCDAMDLELDERESRRPDDGLGLYSRPPAGGECAGLP
jgi:hypothetical protein